MMSFVGTKAERRCVGATIASTGADARGIVPHPCHRRAIVAILASYVLLWQALLACVTTVDWLAPTSLAVGAPMVTVARPDLVDRMVLVGAMQRLTRPKFEAL